MLCWPDAVTWEPHLQRKTKTYNLVLTDFRGHRTFGYCRRIQAEGDDVCLPLAICILTRHGGARGLFSQVKLAAPLIRNLLTLWKGCGNNVNYDYSQYCEWS